MPSPMRLGAMATLKDHQVGHTGLPRSNGSRQARGTCANHQQIYRDVVFTHLDPPFRCCR